MIRDVQQHYSKADVVSFAFDYETVRLDKGEIKKKDIIYNYRYASEMSLFMKWLENN